MTDRLACIEYLVDHLFLVLDREEQSDEGRNFHTTTVNDKTGSFSSVRVQEVIKLSDILAEMKEWLAEK